MHAAASAQRCAKMMMDPLFVQGGLDAVGDNVMVSLHDDLSKTGRLQNRNPMRITGTMKL